jgi:hypothetical protein
MVMNSDRSRKPSDRKPQRSGAKPFKKPFGQDRKFSSDRRREGRLSERPPRRVRIEPDIPDDVEAKALPGKIRAELLSLSAENAEVVAKQMVMIDRLLASASNGDLLLAHQFGRAAVDRAGRVGVVRQYAGRAALAVKEFTEAKKDFSAASRILGLPILKVYLAECEVGLGKARKALEILGEVKIESLSQRETIYARLVSAEAREALEQWDAALVTLASKAEDNLSKLSEEDHGLIDRWRALKARLESARRI